MLQKSAFLTVALLLICTLCPTAFAQGFKAQFTDSLDGKFDLTHWLDKAYGFMPMASIVTEPALGGLGIAGGIVFIHRPVEDRGKPLTSPPSMSALLGMYTKNKSWSGAVFHQGHWREDTIRYRGLIGYVSLNLQYFPPALQDVGLEFNIAGAGLTQRFDFRIKGSPWFVGGEYIFFNNNITFAGLDSIPGADPFEFSQRLGALGPLAVFDTRDYNFTTNRGMYSEVGIHFYDKIFGSDANFNKSKAYWLGWWPHKKFVFGLRLDGRLSNGDTPFYALPYVKLRGIPAMRYQGEYALVAETEERWNLTKRWAVDGFVGIGKAVPDGQTFGEAETVWNVGGGFRYLLARQYNLYGGIDIARGPEDWAWYVVVGQWWNGL